MEKIVVVYSENCIHEGRKHTLMESAEFSLLRNWPLSVMYLKVSTANPLLSRRLPPWISSWKLNPFCANLRPQC